MLFLEASPRLELGVRILQTLALPLGYDAISCIGDADTLCGAGDGVAILDGDLAERTRAGLRILRSSLREAESRQYDFHHFSSLHLVSVMPILCVERETGFGPATFTLAR